MTTSHLHPVPSEADRLHQVRLNRFVDMDPQALETAIAPVRDQLVPVLAQLPGCRTILIGVDLEKGTGTVITFWESEAGLRASDRVETEVRQQAVALAGASMGKGLVDTYSIVLEDRPEAADDGRWARLARWEGVRPTRMREALVNFEKRDLPALQQIPGYRGFLAATNELLGNSLSISLWASREDLEASLEWERGARAAVESLPGMVPRRVITDAYQVPLAPALRQFRLRSNGNGTASARRSDPSEQAMAG